MMKKVIKQTDIAIYWLERTNPFFLICPWQGVHFKEGESQLVKLINSMIAGGDGDKIALFGEPEILKTMKKKYGIN